MLYYKYTRSLSEPCMVLRQHSGEYRSKGGHGGQQEEACTQPGDEKRRAKTNGRGEEFRRLSASGVRLERK